MNLKSVSLLAWIFVLAGVQPLSAQDFNLPSPTDFSSIIRQASQSENGFSSPMIDAETARSMSYDNRVKQVRTYYDRKLMTARKRDQLEQERLARTQRNAAARRQRRELTKKKDPTPISSSQVNRYSGEIEWPVMIKNNHFDQDRDNVDTLYPKHLSAGAGVNTVEYSPIQNSLKSMKSGLSKVRKQYQPEQYSYSKKFLESFIFELTGASDKIDQFCALMDPLGLVEVSRTGVLSIKRGAGKG